MLLPEGSNPIEPGDSGPSSAKCSIALALLVHEHGMLRLERLLLLNALSMQNSQAEGQVGQLAIIPLLGLLQSGVFRAQLLQILQFAIASGIGAAELGGFRSSSSLMMMLMVVVMVFSW